MNNFILNEVEPWHLGLQNQHLGAQARTNYKYISYRRAKYRIVVGKNVTPTTDPGDYVVEANAVLTLKAGEEIHLKPGVHFKAGSSVHLVPEYDVCSDAKSALTKHSDDDDNHNTTVDLNRNEQTEEKREEGFSIFPNPTSNKLTIVAFSDEAIDQITIYNLRGAVCLTSSFSGNTSANTDVSHLEKGVYLIQIQSKEKKYHYKILID